MNNNHFAGHDGEEDEDDPSRFQTPTTRSASARNFLDGLYDDKGESMSGLYKGRVISCVRNFDASIEDVPPGPPDLLAGLMIGRPEITLPMSPLFEQGDTPPRRLEGEQP